VSLERFALILTSGALIGLATLRYSSVTGNVTNSEPLGLYLLLPGVPTRGSMVQLRPLMKHVAAVASDTVRVTREGSYINGRLWPNSGIPSDTHGYQPFPFGTYKLQPRQYWVLGSSPDSWDSRWIGPIPDDLIATSIAPLWTKSLTEKPR
jgi:type IV secretory pathway protease TraF